MSPYAMTKLKSGKVRVSGPSGVHAKATTPTKAKRQLRLLQGIEHGWTPTGKRRRGNFFERKIGRPIQFTPEEIRDLFMDKEKPHGKRNRSAKVRRNAAIR